MNIKGQQKVQQIKTQKKGDFFNSPRQGGYAVQLVGSNIKQPMLVYPADVDKAKVGSRASQDNEFIKSPQANQVMFNYKQRGSTNSRRDLRSVEGNITAEQFALQSRQQLNQKQYSMHQTGSNFTAGQQPVQDYLGADKRIQQIKQNPNGAGNAAHPSRVVNIVPQVSAKAQHHQSSFPSQFFGQTPNQLGGLKQHTFQTKHSESQATTSTTQAQQISGSQIHPQQKPSNTNSSQMFNQQPSASSQSHIKLIEVDQIIKHIRHQQEQYQTQQQLIQYQQQMLLQAAQDDQQTQNQNESQKSLKVKPVGRNFDTLNQNIPSLNSTQKQQNKKPGQPDFFSNQQQESQIISGQEMLAQGSTTTPQIQQRVVSDVGFPSAENTQNLNELGQRSVKKSINESRHVSSFHNADDLATNSMQLCPNNVISGKLRSNGSNKVLSPVKPTIYAQDVLVGSSSIDNRKSSLAAMQQLHAPMKTQHQAISIMNTNAVNKGNNKPSASIILDQYQNILDQHVSNTEHKKQVDLEYQNQLLQYLNYHQPQLLNQPGIQAMHQQSKSHHAQKQMHGTIERTLEKIATHQSQGPKFSQRSQSAIQREQKDQSQPIFINHGDINININLPNNNGVEDQNIKQFILKNLQEQIKTQGSSEDPTYVTNRSSNQKPHSSEGQRVRGGVQLGSFISPYAKNINSQALNRVGQMLQESPQKLRDTNQINSAPNGSIMYQSMKHNSYGQASSIISSSAPTNKHQPTKAQGLHAPQVKAQSSMANTNTQMLGPQGSKHTNAIQQLKQKQVVQFCWQNLVHQYTPEKLKLDIKGKAVSSGGPSSTSGGPYENSTYGIHNSHQPQIITSNPIKSKNSSIMQTSNEPTLSTKNQQQQQLQPPHSLLTSTFNAKQQSSRPAQLQHIEQSAQLQNEAFIAEMKLVRQQQQIQQHLNYLSQVYSQNFLKSAVYQNQLGNLLLQDGNQTYFSALPPTFQHLIHNGQHSKDCKCFQLLQLRYQQIQLQMTKQANERNLAFLQSQSNQQSMQARNQQSQQSSQLNTALSPNKNRQTKIIVQSRMQQINAFIKKLNQLISLTLKATDSINPIAMGQIKKTGQEIGIKWQNHHMDPKFIKSKDFVTFLKSKIYVLFNMVLMKDNMSLFAQIQFMLRLEKEKNNKDKQTSPNKAENAEGVVSSTNASTVANKEDAQQPGLELNANFMIQNQQWLNQIQMYNVLKFKNQGFKFWVEYPTLWGNNFIQVRMVTKRRNWLTWVDYDPYEEREPFVFQQPPPPAPAAPPQLPAPVVIVDEKPTSPEAAKEDATEKPRKKKKKLDSTVDKPPAKVEAPKQEPVPDKVEEPTPQIGPISLPNLIFTQIRKLKIIQDLLPHQMYNHIDGINQIAMKCQLHKNMEAFAMSKGHHKFSVMPETYIIELQPQMTKKYLLDNEKYKEFQKAYTKGSYWILKPGEDANRGHGIKVLDDIRKIEHTICFTFNSGPKQYRTCILQKYIEKPLLVYRRKFDIRVFAMVTYISNFEKSEGILRGWFYEEGYIRTSCKEFNLQAGTDNQFMHLTNDAVQKQSSDYGKYEAGNKISYSDFDKLLLKENNTSFYNKILPQIKKRVTETFQSAGTRLVGEVRTDYNGFEWLGFDFMLDEDIKLHLIEVNTNPCLETQSCLLLQRLIPQMLDQSLKIAADPFFGASEQQYLMNQEFVATELKYSMVFEEVIEGIKNSPSYETDELYKYQVQNNEAIDLEAEAAQNEEAAEENNNGLQEENEEEDTLE